MLNIDVAVNSFWQFARCWKNCEKAKLELSCENGYLGMNLSARLGHPDILHFHPPPPLSPPFQMKTTSKERCADSKEKTKVPKPQTGKSNQWKCKYIHSEWKYFARYIFSGLFSLTSSCTTSFNTHNPFHISDFKSTRIKVWYLWKYSWKSKWSWVPLNEESHWTHTSTKLSNYRLQCNGEEHFSNINLNIDKSTLQYSNIFICDSCTRYISPKDLVENPPIKMFL